MPDAPTSHGSRCTRAQASVEAALRRALLVRNIGSTTVYGLIELAAAKPLTIFRRASALGFQLLECPLHAVRRRVQVGAGHLDVRVTVGRLHLVEFPAGFELLQAEFVAQVMEVQIVNPRLPAGHVPPVIR